jgi:crotonobetainyl-CoA:carnitine CoA-transferase CaiB-like acyl-CoA transferase
MNRNKRSLTLNVQAPEGKALFLKLAGDADVIIENMRPGVVDRLGIGYEATRPSNPRIIYCSISGFGQDGPYRERPGYDTIGQAMGGLLSVLTDLNNPSGVGISIADHVTGVFACYGILAALLARERTGNGQKVETSLLQASIAFGSENAARYLATRQTPRKENRLRLAQVYAFVAGDGLPFVIHLSSPQKFWHGLAEAVGHPDWKEDPRFVNKEGREKNYDLLSGLLREIFQTKPRAHWLELLEAHDVPAAPLMTLDEVFADPQVRHLGMEVELRHPKMGSVRLAGSGIRLSETPVRIAEAPPLLGEHTGEILGEVGLSREEVAALRQKGVL